MAVSANIAKSTDSGDLKITQVRSTNGTKPKQARTLRTLGLGRRGSTALQHDRPEIRGMVDKVSHLVTVEEVG